mgnify:CR=1 FL=1
MMIEFQKRKMVVIPSVANFLTLVFDDKQEAKLFNRLMINHGIILRYLSDWGLPCCVRITVGTENENKYFIQSIGKILKE